MIIKERFKKKTYRNWKNLCIVEVFVISFKKEKFFPNSFQFHSIREHCALSKILLFFKKNLGVASKFSLW